MGATAKGTAREFTKFDGKVKGFGKNFGQTFRQSSLAFGRFGTLLRAGIIGGSLFGLGAAITKTVTSFRDFETALVGVGKTTDLAGRELEVFGSSIQELGRRIPIPTNELLRLAQVAAQLGIRGEKNLRKFAETGARLAVSTNVGAEEAVTALSRIIGITGESSDSVERLGDSLVFLGNNFKTSEAEILTAARRISQSTAGFGLLGDDILAIAASLKEAGVQAESGGTAIGRVFREISEAINDGGSQLEGFTRVTGLTADQLKEKLAKDAAGTFKLFIEGLNASVRGGTDLGVTLKQLELNSDRVQATLRPLVSISNRVGDAFAGVAKSDGQLFKESEKQFNTVASLLVKLNNSFNDIFTNLGKAEAGVLNEILTALVKLTGATAKAIDPVKDYDQEINEVIISINEYQDEIDKLQQKLDEGITVTATGSGEIIDITEAIKEQRKQIILLSIEQGKLEAQRDAAKAKRKKEKEGVDGGLTPDQIQKQLNLEEAFNQARALNTQEFELQQIEAREALGEEQLNSLSDLLGEREAVVLASQAQELINENKQAEALKLIRDQLAKADLERIKKTEASKINLEKQTTQQRVGLLSNAGNLINAIAGKQTKAGFLLSKAAAAGQVLIADGQARAAAQAAAAIASIPTGGTTFGPQLATLNSIITANTALSLATIAAQAIKGFQDGGVVGGNSFTGDNVLARVNSGEMILNRQQQANLFAQANGAGGGGQEIVVNTTVEVEGQAIAKAVSRQVANGVELGEFE